MLRSCCDGLGGRLLVRFDWGWIDEFSAELGEAADGGDGLLHASPAAAGPVEYRPHQRQARAFAGEPADDLHSPAGLAEGARGEDGAGDWPPLARGGGAGGGTG